MREREKKLKKKVMIGMRCQREEGDKKKNEACDEMRECIVTKAVSSKDKDGLKEKHKRQKRTG